jgi:parvulin-like peptidyl-prolyl isomerase
MVRNRRKGASLLQPGRKEYAMRRFMTLTLLIIVAGSLLWGCGKVEDKPVVRITDPEGTLSPRVVTVGYVNERLDRLPPMLIPDVAGEEGKRQFLEDIIRKELVVVASKRLGLREDPRLEDAIPYLRKKKAEEMLQNDLLNRPSEATDADIEEYHKHKDSTYQMQEIVVQDETLAQEVYQRVTEGGEDFGTVAAEVSTAQSATDLGRKPVMVWQDLHPVIKVAVRNLEKGDITQPIRIGDTFYIFYVNSFKQAANAKPLDETRRTTLALEAKNFKRSILENELYEGWLKDSGFTMFDEAAEIAGTRIVEQVTELIPQDTEGMTIEERMELLRIPIVPEFTEDEAPVELAGYQVGGVDYVVTLGDLEEEMAALPGMETLKGGEPGRIRGYLLRVMQQKISEYEIGQRGYYDTKELGDYVEQRLEEIAVDFVYEQEVNAKVEEPMGQDVRDYYRSHKEDFMTPLRVDVQQIIVGTEGEANLLFQRLKAGEAGFGELVQKHSIDEWSKSKNGVIQGYEQGERRLDYLQGVAFSLEKDEIGEPVRAPGGYAIVKCLQIYPEQQRTFSEVADVVKTSVWNINKEARLLEFLDGVRSTVDVEIIDGNLQYMKDPAEVLDEKEASKTSFTKTMR